MNTVYSHEATREALLLSPYPTFPRPGEGVPETSDSHLCLFLRLDDEPPNVAVDGLHVCGGQRRIAGFNP